MLINTDTKLIGRFHNENNGTGLNIYNPYFEYMGVNVTYLLFINEVKPLVEGMRNLVLCGAVTAGFEHSAELFDLVDEVSESAKLTRRIGVIANHKGVLSAHYQGGEGLLGAVLEKIDIKDKKIVIVGAGAVAKSFILALSQNTNRPAGVVIVNRTTENAATLVDEFDFVESVRSLDSLADQKGDILINASRIGSKIPDELFNEDIVRGYQAVADVSFGNPETNLITTARQNGIVSIDGWDMFTHQVAIVLRFCINHEADIQRLRRFVRLGLAKSNHGVKPGNE